jgi:hypothetical protein
MASQITFVLKVLLLSAGLAVAIRYLAPLLNVPATAVTALVMVLVPMLIVAIGLGWRSRHTPVSHAKDLLETEQKGKIY